MILISLFGDRYSFRDWSPAFLCICYCVFGCFLVYLLVLLSVLISILFLGVCLILCLSLFFCDGVIWCFLNGLSVCYWVIILLFVFFAFLTVVHVDTGPFVFFVRSLLQVLSDCMLVFVLVCLLTVVHSDTGPFVFSLSSIKISPFSLSYRINEA